MARRSSKGSASSASRPSSLEKLQMLRDFCPSFSEQDLSNCLSQAAYNVELAAERLMTGQYQPKASKAKPNETIVSISNVKPAPNSSRKTKTTGTISSTTTKSITPATAKKRSSPDSLSASISDSDSRKKRSPHVMPATPVATTGTAIKNDIPNTAFLLCERWLVGTCLTRNGKVAHQEELELNHYHTGKNTNVRFRGKSIEGNLSRSLSAMLTPLLRYEHEPALLKLRAEALMEDRNIPMGGEVPLKLAVYLSAPKAFFSIFDTQSLPKSSSSMYFAKHKQFDKNANHKMTLPEAAFAFLEWAEYGHLREIPEFSTQDDNDNPLSKNEEVSDKGSSNGTDEDSDVLVQDEDEFSVEEGSANRPEWASSVNDSESDKQSLPELEDPEGFKSIALRPYQRQALYWMMKREQEGESREELERELELLSELASRQNGSKTTTPAVGPSKIHSQQQVSCDCGPVLVSESARKAAKTLVGQSNLVNHPLWKTRYLSDTTLDNAFLFYVNEVLGIATWEPPIPPKACVGGILADDMGLGKTVMLLALILKCKQKFNAEGTCEKDGPTLVVAPLSLVSQWEAEIQTKTSLSHLVFYQDKGKLSANDSESVDIVITTYGTMQSEMQRQQKCPDQLAGIFKQKWLRVILDEAHCVKNPATLSSKACCALQAQYRWVVTGTVIHNSLDDVYSLIKFLRHEPWCSSAFWKAAITKEVNRIEKGETQSSAEQTGMMVALGRIKRLLAPLMLRRTKDSLSPDGTPIIVLPPVERRVVEVEFSKAEKDFYSALLDRSLNIFEGMIRKGTASQSWFTIFSLLSRLRQACVHISLTVKSHIGEDEWNSASSAVESAEEGPSTAAVDDDFINGLLKKFSDSTKEHSYSESVAHKLHGAIKDNVTHIAEECSICLETPLIVDAIMTSSCAHIFCKKCLFDVLNAKEKQSHFMKQNGCADGICPVCQTELKSKELIMFSRNHEDGTYRSTCLGEEIGSPGVKGSRGARQTLQDAINGAQSSKLSAVIDELHNVWKMDPASKVIVFSQFLGTLDLLARQFKENDIPYHRMDGSMSLKQRNAALEKFQSKQAAPQNSGSGPLSAKQRVGSVMLASMKATGVGLNLVAASTVFIVDPWWNASIEDQCINRVHRIGQMAPVVRVRKFVMKNSVEERIVELQQKKQAIATEVYSDVTRDGTMRSSRPTLEDFKMIFSNL